MKQIIFPTCVMGMNRIHRWCVAKNVGLNWSHLCSVCISFSKDLIMYQWNYPPWNWHSTWKDGIPKGNRIVFQPSIFSCLVSGRVIILNQIKSYPPGNGCSYPMWGSLENHLQKCQLGGDTLVPRDPRRVVKSSHHPRPLVSGFSPTHLKNMIVKLDHVPKLRGKNV